MDRMNADRIIHLNAHSIKSEALFFPKVKCSESAAVSMLDAARSYVLKQPDIMYCSCRRRRLTTLVRLWNDFAYYCLCKAIEETPVTSTIHRQLTTLCFQDG